jgi:hypothetical protein
MAFPPLALVIPKMTPAAAAPAARDIAHHELADVAAQFAEFHPLLQRFIAGVGEGHLDDFLDPGRPRRHHKGRPTQRKNSS